MTDSSIPKPFIKKILALQILRENEPPKSDFLEWEDTDAGLSCYYAPFDYLNRKAKLILVGITPGRTQMNRALNAARDALEAHASVGEAVRRIKREGSFSGRMRPNLIAILNRLGYQSRLGLSCASSLWKDNDHLVHFCSLLKYPVFLNGKDYNGSPHPLENDRLKAMVIKHFVSDMNVLAPDAMLVPLGNAVLDTIVSLKQDKRISQRLKLFQGQPVAPPHPSPSNTESISLLLERRYPSKIEYERRMYSEYLRRKPWEKEKGGKPQTEARYRAARGARWKSMLLVRRAYGIPDMA